MDDPTFDILTRRLRRARSRRRAMGGVLLGALGLLGVSHDHTVAKKKKKPCPPCKKRKKGKCKGLLPDGAACAGGECQLGRCVATECGAGGPCRVFLSSTRYDGNLGGLSGADAKCQALAEAAGVPGTYRAWLSDSTSAPISRFTPSRGPYRLLTGTTIAADWADLVDGVLAAPITVTETGGSGGEAPFVWTYTRSDGTAGGLYGHCGNWGSNVAGAPGGDVGLATQRDAVWTASGSTTFCNVPQHLYCFQQH